MPWETTWQCSLISLKYTNAQPGLPLTKFIRRNRVDQGYRFRSPLCVLFFSFSLRSCLASLSLSLCSLSCSFLRTLGPPVCKPCCSSPTHYAESFVQWFPKQFWGKCRCPDSSHSQFFWRRGPRNLFLNKLSKGSMTSQTWGILAQLLPFIG